MTTQGIAPRDASKESCFRCYECMSDPAWVREYRVAEAPHVPHGSIDLAILADICS